MDEGNNISSALARAQERQSKQDERIARDLSHGDTAVALALAGDHLRKVSEAVSIWASQPNSDHEKALALILRNLKPEQVALCLLQSAIHCVTLELRFTASAVHVGEELEAECWGAKLIEDKPQLAKRILREVVKKHGNLRARRSTARQAAIRSEYQFKDWPEEQALHAGAWGLNLLVRALPRVFHWKAVKGGEPHNKQERLIQFVPGATDIAEALVAELVRRNPVYIPQAEPPEVWTDVNSGGPKDARLFRSPLIRKAPHIYRPAGQAIKNGTMQPVLDAINALQSVPWKINQRVLSVMRECMDKDDINFLRDLKTAEELGTGPFWTPMNIDWRGRVYSMTAFNYQRNDTVRSLFLFADGEPIGEDGLHWLKVHLANCGEDENIHKKSFDERVEWVDRNIDQIKVAALFPFESREWWTKAKNPFQFLAGCFELVDAIEAGPDFVSHLPVGFDGSCSGLQHLCAMTRSPEGSRVNLTPNPTPQDVYKDVADKVSDNLKSVVEKDVDTDAVTLAKKWLDYGIDREIVKQNVMTFTYGSTLFGMAEQQRAKLNKRQKHSFGNARMQKKTAMFLAKHVRAAIEEVVVLPAQAMNFLQNVARALAKENKPVCWTTPTGLPWINRYYEEDKKRVRLFLHDRGVRISYMPVIYAEGKAINKKKSINGIAPNFVHACDAAHLMRVVIRAASEGIKNLATVHDSFGCLAPRANRFRQIIREEFVRMYEEHDVLAEILEQARNDLSKQQNKKALPKLPPYGLLDIKEVLKADYAFA
jgi:DNA-directed RNA polymerase